jgi:hypothetical protein
MKNKIAAAILGLALLLSGTGIASAATQPGSITTGYIQARLSAITAELQTLLQQAEQAGLVDTLGGDFAGGITPSNLFTASTATNSVTPILSNVLVPGTVSVGGTGVNNQVTTVYTGVATYPSAAVTLLSSSTPFGSATTTQVAFTASGFSVGDPCEVEYTFTTSTVLTSANVTAVSGNAVTSTATFLNTIGSSITLTVTSTVTGVSSTVKTTCFHTGV